MDILYILGGCFLDNYILGDIMKLHKIGSGENGYTCFDSDGFCWYSGTIKQAYNFDNIEEAISKLPNRDMSQYKESLL